MNGIAFKDNSGAWKNEAWKNLIPHPDDEFDSCIWLYDSQAYWDIPDFDYDIIDEMAARCLTFCREVPFLSDSEGGG